MLEELKEANGYVVGKIKEKDELILESEKYAAENNVPIVTKEVAEYLKFMVDMNRSQNILEVGTAIGYFLDHYGKSSSKIWWESLQQLKLMKRDTKKQI